MNRYAEICTDMHRYAQICTDMHRYTNIWTDTGLIHTDINRYSRYEKILTYCHIFTRYERLWWPSTAHIGTKMLYLPGCSPDSDPVVYVVQLSHILGRLPLVPTGDAGTIPYSMRDGMAACYEHGICRAAASFTSTHGPWFGRQTTTLLLSDQSDGPLPCVIQ